jgi:hypothetical protein
LPEVESQLGATDTANWVTDESSACKGPLITARISPRIESLVILDA